MQANIFGRLRLIPDFPSWPHDEIASAGNHNIRDSLESVHGCEDYSTVYNEIKLKLGDCLVSKLKLRALSAEAFEALLILSLTSINFGQLRVCFLRHSRQPIPRNARWT